MEMESLRALFVDELKDLWSAEKQLVKALPRMAKNATDPELQQAFVEHLAVTEGQVERIERICEMVGESPRGKKCIGMEGLIEEAAELLEEDPEPEVLDAGLISKAQHVEHYEIAGYGTLRTYALTLGLADAAELLQQSLNEEKEADKQLSALAEGWINQVAAAPSEEASADREVAMPVESENRRGREKSKRATRTSSQHARSR
jgi:ferritin-like metal-binding protein YciE